MLTLRRSAVEQICLCDEGVYLMYTTEEDGQRCQHLTEAMLILDKRRKLPFISIVGLDGHN